jgi:UDP-N-acetylmuramoyl-tripeptide--D-alanyl-D-alanine ligase
MSSDLITGFSWDSRSVKPGDLFLAITGSRADGHDFAGQALRAGAVAVLAERPVPGPHVQVTDLVEALALFAADRRSRFSGPVIGVTGSNGKTTTKELTAAAVSSLGPVLKSPANHNTEYTSPLVWAEADGKAVAVIEMAMRGFDQIRHLATFARPTVGVVTCIGTAHVEMVGSREGIMRAKAELLESLPSAGAGIVWREDDFYLELVSRSAAPVRTFGFSQEAECRIVGYRALAWDRCAVRVALAGKTVDFELPTLGRHQALNAAAALLVADTVGVSVEVAAENLEKTEWPPMRMEIVRRHGATVILDTYNASPDSTVAGLAALSEVPVDGERLAVLGEMKELGDFTESGHRLVGAALAGSAVDRAYLTGGPTAFIADEAFQRGFPREAVQIAESLDLGRVTEFLRSAGEGDVVLVKGSRALGLERAVEAWQ